ncbi:MAG TPA: MEDS domain-containing protein [Armatimonadota bacterium]|jgi:hypothetical protein
MYMHTGDQPMLELGFRDHSCNWGTHICGLFETPEERDEILVGFLHAGDEAGDLQLCCTTERTPEQFHQDYSRAYPCCAGRSRDGGSFTLASPEELYYPNGSFSPWEMTQGLESFFARSQAQGPRNVRATADMSWSLRAIPGIESLMIYESRLNYFIPGKPWVSICLYDLKRFSGATIMGVLRTHPYTISGGVITTNPYYQSPDEWLSQNAPEYLRSMTPQ